MALTPPTSPLARDFASVLANIEARLTAIEVGLRTGQLGNSSVQNSGINAYDSDGNLRYTIGKQIDGAFAGVSMNNPNPPPVPSQPVVIPGKGSLTIRYEGETNIGAGLPSDWSHANVYVAPPSGEYAFIGTIISIPGDFIYAPAEYVLHSVKLTNVNYSGKESGFGPVSQGTPELVVGEDLTAGIVQEIHIAADAVTAAKIAANSISTAKIQDNAVTLAELANGSVSASQIIDGAVQAGKIAADAVGTNELAANSIVAGKIAANAVTAEKILAGAIEAGKLAVDSVQAGNIVAAAVTTAKLAALAITADKIAANAIEAGKILAGAVTADKLEADLVIAERIIAGDPIAARVELHPTEGFQSFTSTGERRVQITPEGDAYFNGTVYAGLPTGQSVALDPIAWGTGGGFPYPRVDLWDDTGTHYGQVAHNVNDLIIARKLKVGNTNQGGRLTLNATGAGADFLNSSAVITAHMHVNSNSVGFRVSSTELFYLLTGGSEQKLEATSRGSGLTFATGKLFVGNNSGTSIPIEASAFTVASSRSLKENLRPLSEDGETARSILKKARGLKWNYIEGDSEKTHIGPIADDLPEWLTMQAEDGLRRVGAHDLAGMAWEAAAEAGDGIDQANRVINGLQEKVAQLEAEILVLKERTGRGTE